MTIEFTPIGIINSSFTEPHGMPIQPPGAAGEKGTVTVFKEFCDGLKDLDGFSHIILLYHFHRSTGFKLHITPFMDSQPRGLFSTRAPRRPNRIGLSVVKLIEINGCVLSVENIDILDDTPLLDIKPYVPDFNPQRETRTGWLGKVSRRVKKKRSDGRFAGDKR